MSETSENLAYTPGTRPIPSSPTPEDWNREYGQHDAIPSSHRSDPSQAFVELAEHIDWSEISMAAEVGCGNGRNLAFLADNGVDAVGFDFSPVAIRLAKQAVAVSGRSAHVDLALADVSKGLPLHPNAVDLVIDSYLSCHFTTAQERDSYFDSIRSSLAIDGLLYWSVLSTHDEYYQQFLDDDVAPPIVVDPLNQIPKYLYSKEEFNAGPPGFKSVETVELRFEDDVNGTVFNRSILAGLFKLNNVDSRKRNGGER